MESVAELKARDARKEIHTHRVHSPGGPVPGP